MKEYKQLADYLKEEMTNRIRLLEKIIEGMENAINSQDDKRSKHMTSMLGSYIRIDEFRVKTEEAKWFLSLIEKWKEVQKGENQ